VTTTLEAKRELAALLEEKKRRRELVESLPWEWAPRDYQRALWDYLVQGGKRAVAVWHRRAGKDDIALHWTCKAAHQRVGTYWHLLPQAAQARKAVWDAVNPYTGKRRIDEAFPRDLRATTRENEMMIRLRNGSTWQVVGSDNFNALVGSPPVGVVLSEWALADPHAWAYLRPILDENHGWAMFIFTPRGRNHALRTLELARSEPGWFAQTLTADDTAIFAPDDLDRIRREMIAEWGEDDAEALYTQEYYVSFDAPLIGAYYAKLVARADAEGRMPHDVPAEPGVPIETAWDLGYTDDTVIWWFQVIGREVRILDYYSAHGETVEHYCDVVRDRGWDYGPAKRQRHWVPWDARPKTLASGGKSILEQAWAHGVHMKVAPNLSVQDGIQAVRQVLPRCHFARGRCGDGIEALRNYKREWDDDKKAFRNKPLHDWASHPSDAFRILALAWKERAIPKDEKPKEMKGMDAVTLDTLFEDRERRERQL